MATGDNLKNTKAVAAAVIGFLAPGASYLIAVSSDGVSGQEWLIAGLTSIVTAGVSFGVVHQVENKEKV
jgi:hypothetical protein